MEFACWKCGTPVRDEPMPLGRETRCRACEADLHVCRQCRFFDPSRAKSCAEPVADEVRDKERANFCGYFEINPSAHAGPAEADAARRELESMFGMTKEEAAKPESPDPAAAGKRRRDAADAARDELSKLFGLDDE